MFRYHSVNNSVRNNSNICHDFDMLWQEISFPILKAFVFPDKLSFLSTINIWWFSPFILHFLFKYGNRFFGISIFSCTRDLWVILVYFTNWYTEFSVTKMNPWRKYRKYFLFEHNSKNNSLPHKSFLISKQKR